MPAAKRILCIDVGGSGLKAAIISPRGKYLAKRVRMKTPMDRKPKQVVAALIDLIAPLGRFDHVTIGFPGVVKDGKVISAPHFGTKAWKGFDLAVAMRKKLKKPVKLLNDADVQGLAAIRGKGLELVCTLGTGLGTAWFRDGELMPHMDLAHLAMRKKDDFDILVGDQTRRKIGNNRWNRRIKKLILVLKVVFNYDHLYLGGGNSLCVEFTLPRNVTIVSNDAGMQGGAFAWSRCKVSSHKR
ncbi:MAG TPA: ROK family protein [Rhizomicrobium sp.]|nr:ROK family protein [Rhizomicrobium sp.]